MTPRSWRGRPYDIRDEKNNLTQVKQGRSFLYKTEQETFETGDSERRVVDIIPLGSTGSGRDVIMVRGAERYDQVCLFDGQHDPPRVGCEVITGSSPSVQIFEVEGWQPEIIVSPIITVTPAVTSTRPITAGGVVTSEVVITEGEVSASRLAVTVTLPISVASGRLMAQVIPAYSDGTRWRSSNRTAGPMLADRWSERCWSWRRRGTVRASRGSMPVRSSRASGSRGVCTGLGAGQADP